MKKVLSPQIHSEDSTLSHHRAQLIWSFCVAIIVAIVALKQVRGSNLVNHPTAYQTVQPLPLNQADSQD